MCGNARAGWQAAATLCAARLGAAGTSETQTCTHPRRGYSNAIAEFVSDFAELRFISLCQGVAVKLVVVMNSMWYLCGLYLHSRMRIALRATRIVPRCKPARQTLVGDGYLIGSHTLSGSTRTGVSFASRRRCAAVDAPPSRAARLSSGQDDILRDCSCGTDRCKSVRPAVPSGE